MELANEIYNQLGGRKFAVMTGAKNLIAIKNGLQFSLPGGGGFCRNGINGVQITLNGLDLYDVKFYRIRGINMKEIAYHENIYNDMLPTIFEKETGSRTSL